MSGILHPVQEIAPQLQKLCRTTATAVLAGRGFIAIAQSGGEDAALLQFIDPKEPVPDRLLHAPRVAWVVCGRPLPGPQQRAVTMLRMRDGSALDQEWTWQGTASTLTELPSTHEHLWTPWP